MFITDKQLDDWKENIIGAVKANFMDDGHLMPVAMIYGRNGNHKIYGAVFETESDKDKFNKFIREEIKSCDALAYIFIAEAWRTKHAIADKEKYKNADGTYKRPSESPDKIETAFIVFETNLKNETIMFDIDRSGAKPVLINEDRQYQSCSGRFSDILKKPIIKN